MRPWVKWTCAAFLAVAAAGSMDAIYVSGETAGMYRCMGTLR